MSFEQDLAQAAANARYIKTSMRADRLVREATIEAATAIVRNEHWEGAFRDRRTYV